jgi:uncharacterized protein YndB with AHSA1/START domain
MTREDGTIERDIFIAAPPETVFEFLTDARLMAQWLGSFYELDPRPGGVFQVEVSPGNIAVVKYTEIVPIRRVAFTWGWNSLRPDLAALGPGESLVEIELERREGGTHLRLRHSRLPEELRPIHNERWTAHLGRLTLLFDARPRKSRSPRTPRGE